MKRFRGFTLIELMIAVAIVGILAAIVLPSYQGQMRKTRRGTAQGFMMDVAQREQARFMDARSYTAVAEDTTGNANGNTTDDNENFPAALGLAAPTEITDLFAFRVDLVAGPPPGFNVIAVANGSQDYKNSEDLILRSDGTKARGDAATSTWTKPW